MKPNIQNANIFTKEVINHNKNRIDKNMKSNNSQAYESGDIITYELRAS